MWQGEGSYSTKQNIAGAKKEDGKVIMTLKNKNKNITGYMLTIYETPDFQVEKRVNEPQNMGQSTLRKNS